MLGLVLDKEQSLAVRKMDKAYLVVAGAGSGKTLTIVGKVQYLVQEKKINPQEILCISFTKETVSSLMKSFSKAGLDVQAMTFHRFAMTFLPPDSYKIAPSNLLDYVISEFFGSLISLDSALEDLLQSYLKEHRLVLEEFLSSFSSLASSFIHRFKTYDYSLSFFLELLHRPGIPKDDLIFLVLIFKIYVIYQEELEGSGMIDFDDMISLAIARVDMKKYFRYRYIIIDEYQDTSFSKYQLVKKIMDRFPVSLMAVGDDFQSIYSFTGCDVSLFLHFQKLFPSSSVVKIQNTYRNPKDIVDISSRFVLKNKRQMRKRLKSNYLEKGAISVVYSKEVLKDFLTLIEPLDHILVLGRNHRDVEVLTSSEEIRQEGKKLLASSYPEKDIQFLTVHASKGLESDYVVLLHLVDDFLGFPSKLPISPLLKYLKEEEDIFPYAEERRLFYVALTRAKKKVFLFTNHENSSIFVQELLKDYSWKIKIIDFEEKNFP